MNGFTILTSYSIESTQSTATTYLPSSSYGDQTSSSSVVPVSYTSGSNSIGDDFVFKGQALTSSTTLPLQEGILYFIVI